MARLFLHVGMPKTGTTFLQKGLFDRRAALSERGILYPDPIAGLGPAVSPSIAHHWLAHALMKRRKGYTPSADFSLLDEHIAALKAEISNPALSAAVVSSEEFSGFREPLIQRLRSIFPEPDTAVVVYVRRQDLWLESYFAQLVKVSRATSIHDLLEKEAWRLDYDSCLKVWSSHFGESNIILRPYGRDENLPDLWTDFFRSIGHEQASEIVPIQPSVNQSLSYQLTMFSKAVSRYGYHLGFRRMLDKVNSYYPQTGEGLKYLSLSEAELIRARFAQSNKDVAQRYLGRDSLFLDDELVLQPHGELTAEQYAEVLGGVCIELLDRIGKLERRVRKMQIGE